MIDPEFKFFIPEPVSNNKLYIKGRGRHIMTPEYREWVQKTSIWINSLKNTMENKDMFPLEKGYKFNLYMVRWNNRVKDVSNYLKAAEDLMVRCGVLMDDRYLDGSSAEWISKTDWSALMEREKYDDFVKAFILIKKRKEMNIYERLEKA